MSKEIVPLNSEEKRLVVETARAMSAYEDEIARKWDDLFVKARNGLKDSDRAIRDFKEAVWLLLTSLADGDFSAYYNRIDEKGADFANTKERYENLILSIHLYEDASFPYLQEHFTEQIDQVRSTLDHLYHNVIAILARAYFRELEREREKFVNVLAHDLKSPLTTIVGFASLLIESDDRKLPLEKKLTYLNVIKNSGERMRQLIDSALSYGKLKSGKLTVQLVEINAIAVVKEALTFLLSDMEKAGLSISINGHDLRDWENIKPVNLFADRDWLLRAMLNYISNAIKYTKSRISILVQEREPDILISVEDDGRGISPDQISLIFEDYYMAPGGKPGTGLGLPSVRMIASLHNGKAWAESEIGKGSTFYLRLPKKQGSL